MAQFPKSEAEIMALAQDLSGGLTTHADLFPAPPVSADALREKIAAYGNARDAATAAQARASETTTAKKAALSDLTDAMKVVLRYAEIMVQDDTQLARIGWSGRRARSALERPGQCGSLAVVQQNKGSVTLAWKEPADGGKPAAYIIQRRELPDGAWTNAGTAVDTEATLTDQPRGKTLEFRVLAVNKAGNGEASNVVAVVL
jgi:hypothetical protein